MIHSDYGYASNLVIRPIAYLCILNLILYEPSNPHFGAKSVMLQQSALECKYVVREILLRTALTLKIPPFLHPIRAAPQPTVHAYVVHPEETTSIDTTLFGNKKSQAKKMFYLRIEAVSHAFVA